MNIQDIRTLADREAGWITRQRRALHRIPEEGFQEHETRAHLRRCLSEMNIPVVSGDDQPWVVGAIEGEQPGPCVALRADIDALPIQEPEGLEFRSQHDGWMHACGHDAHMAIQLGAAKLLSGALRGALRGRVRLLFQPAEETDGGALPMVKAGLMEDVDFVYGLHVQPYMKVGWMDTSLGCLNASTDEVNLTVHGVSGHAARPETGNDAIVTAAALVQALQTAVSRSISPLRPAVLTFGKIEGGSARNVLCDRVNLFGTLRAASPEVRADMQRRICEICQGVAAAFDTSIDVNIVEGYCPLVNHEEEAKRVLRLGEALLGEGRASLRRDPSMGGEDFSFFVREKPGAFWHLGCSEDLPAPSLHSRDFRLDERCLPIGAAMQAGLVLSAMGALN